MTKDHVQAGPSVSLNPFHRGRCEQNQVRATNKAGKKRQGLAKEDPSSPPALCRAHQDGKAINKASLFSSQKAY